MENLIFFYKYFTRENRRKVNALRLPFGGRIFGGNLNWKGFSIYKNFEKIVLSYVIYIWSGESQSEKKCNSKKWINKSDKKINLIQGKKFLL